jgi:hypothetical protein
MPPPDLQPGVTYYYKVADSSGSSTDSDRAAKLAAALRDGDTLSFTVRGGLGSSSDTQQQQTTAADAQVDWCITCTPYFPD